MLHNEFLYFICDDAGNTYAVDVDGSIVTTPSPVPLQFTPKGWRDAAFQYKRNTSNSGVIRTSTTPFGFVKDGAKILRYLWYNYGIEALGNLALAKLDPADLKHKKYYYGAINFTQATDEKDEFECEVTEAGLSMMIKANENTKYEIPLDVPEAIDLRHDGLVLKASASYTVQSGPFTKGFSFLGLLFIQSEGTFANVLFGSAYNFTDIGTSLPPDDPNFIINNLGASVVFNIDIHYQARLTDHGPADYIVSWAKSDGANFTGDAALYNGTINENFQDFHFQFSVTLNQGERFYITQFNSEPALGAIEFAEGGTMNVTFDYRYRQTEIKCLRPLYVFQKLIEKITDGKYTATSTLLDTVAKDFVLTCGDGIRSIAGAKIKTSLKDFFTSFNTRFSIGLGNRDEVAVIEAKSAFFTSDVIADLGEVADCQITNASDYLWNTLKIGWPAQDYDDINGKDEFNNTHNYTSPVKRLGKELDLTAPYRCDPYGIEFTRINLDGKSTTDNESDNDVFIINIADNGSGGYILNRPAYTALSGVRAGSSIFNVELSPARCVIANGSFLHIGMDLLDTGSLTFQTTEKNAALSTTLDGVTIAENQNFLIGSLAAKLFLPKMFQIECQVPLNIVDLIEVNPYGKIRFKWLGNTCKGYIVEAGQQAATNAKQSFKLLASTDNDMTKLIH